ncbi:SDR family NAD(P)-dependent oxidoreductase [Edaphobacter sp.]|uniref:SDR family NAD(P)-dependent oxidoreductase n=1 Tax=Edaphobacter sp. TaxID=1934404 RepID=UPI002DBDE36F|nr:SDR family oxidoreductase [Edaphobacter sp.]HEU5342468.1 SDR family oxidoreductase [Edaphobacter sp.]
MPESNFTNQLAVVFGGGRDIGAAIAIELASRGAKVAFSYHQSQPDKVIAAVESHGQSAIAQKVDAMDTAAVRAFIASATKATDKPIGVLVNVVGGLVARKKMDEMDDSFWEHVMNLNVRSVFAAIQAALPVMADSGAIVNVSSQAGRDGGGPGSVAYGASKGALMSMTRGLAKELGPRRIRVNAVCPGMIATKFHDDFTKPEVRQRVASMTPLGREGKAEEVATLVAFLAGSGAAFVNGACVDINGGILFS